jgi:hypothetical protein
MTSQRTWPGRTARLSILLVVAAALLLVFAGPGHRLGLVPVKIAVYSSAAAGLIALIAGLIGVIALTGSLATGRRDALLPALLGTTAGAIVGLHMLSWVQTARSVPQIHDITTDLADPPVFVAVAPLRADAPNPAAYDGPDTAAAQREAYPDIQTVRFPGVSADEVIRAARRAALESGWDVVAYAETEGRLEATDTTFWFGYKDDIVVRVKATGDGAELDVRSKSRVGLSDLGTNAARIRGYTHAVRSLLAA